MTVPSRCAVPQVRSRKAGVRDLACPGRVTHCLDDVPMCTSHADLRARHMTAERAAAILRQQQPLVDSDDPEVAEIAATTVRFMLRIVEHHRTHGAT